VLSDADGEAWRTSEARLAALSPDDLDDFVELEFMTEDLGADSALVLRMRNSLLNTVMFYDVMLRGLGFEALDWMSGKGLTLDMMRSALWYKERMGMIVSVWANGRYEEVARIKDQGPIAWKDIAIRVPVRGDRTRVRLSFVADNWRLDSAAIGRARSVDFRAIPVTPDGGLVTSRLAESLAKADDGYFVTRPGDHIQFSFETSAPVKGRDRTYFLSATGYYVEWIRQEWLRDSLPVDHHNIASDKALWSAMQLWQERRDEFRDQFESLRISKR
jgi:hypothetical protein